MCFIYTDVLFMSNFDIIFFFFTLPTLGVIFEIATTALYL